MICIALAAAVGCTKYVQYLGRCTYVVSAGKRSRTSLASLRSTELPNSQGRDEAQP